MLFDLGGAPAPIVASPAWDWRATPGRHIGELLYVREDADGQAALMRYDRAAHASARIVSAYAGVAVGDAVYYVADDNENLVRRRRGDQDEAFVRMPAGVTPYIFTAAPDRRRLAVVTSDVDGAYGLCIVEVDDGAITCASFDRFVNGRVEFSGDGSSVYYAAEDGMHRRHLTSGADELVLAGRLPGGGIARSPDGRLLVYSDCRTYGTILAVGRGEPEVLVEDATSSAPAGAPDGSLAWIAEGAAWDSRLMVRRPGQPVRVVVEPGLGRLGAPAWDGTGTRLAFTSAVAHAGVYTIDVDRPGARPAQVSADVGDRGPVWTRDGTLVVTRWDDAGRARVVRLGGPPAEVLIEDRVVQDIDRATGELLLLRVDQTRLSFLEPLTRRERRIRLGVADEGKILDARVGLDSRWLAVVGGRSGRNLWRVPLDGKPAEKLYTLSDGQTAGHPGVLADGRIAYRPELWLGELHAVERADGGTF